ncbi:MAG: hypothetical protein KAT65_08680 [Methanophagales archaeon]|nr:hypothetical protein [Methanophagales archaeon]
MGKEVKSSAIKKMPTPWCESRRGRWGKEESPKRQEVKDEKKGKRKPKTGKKIPNAFFSKARFG